MKDLGVAIILAVIMLLNLADVVTDINLGVPTWHIIEECLIVLAAGVTAGYLMLETRRRARQLEQLKRTLSKADRQIADITAMRGVTIPLSVNDRPIIAQAISQSVRPARIAVFGPGPKRGRNAA